jgi:hypothetical protein
MPQGNRGHIGIKKEVTWGTKVVGANDFALPFISETLTPDIEDVVSAAQRGILDEPISYQGEKAFAGDIVIEVKPASFGAILRSAINEPATATPAATTETELEDCEDAWVGATSVISGIDVDDKKKGSASVKIQVTSGASTGILASKAISSTDMHLDTALKLWIKSDVACDSGDLSMRISEQAAGGTGGTYQDVLVPALTAGIWLECTVNFTTMTDYNAVISVALILVVDKGEMTTHIDDVRRIVAGTSATAKQHVFTPRQATDFHADCPINPYSLEVYRDEGLAFQFVGAVFNTLKLDFSTKDKILKATCGVIAKNLTEVAVTSLAFETTNPFLWDNAVISIATSPNNDMEAFSINFDNKCVGKYALNNTSVIRKIIRDGYRAIPVTFTIDFVDRVQYALFLLGTEQAFCVKFEGAICDVATGVKYTLQIDMPLVRYTAYPINVGGPGRLVCKVNGKAKYSTSLGYAILPTLINLETGY